MAYTFPWDESFPPGTQSADQINEDLQRVLVQTRERLVDILGIVFPNDTVTTATASKLVLKGSATSKIIPGATSHSIRNNADSADNLLVNDNGNIIPRNNIGNSNYSLAVSASQGQLTLQSTGGGSIGWIFSANTSDRLTLTRIGGSQIFSVDPSGPVTFGSNLIVSGGGITVTGTSAFAGGFQVSFSGSIVVSGSTVIIDGTAGIKRTIRYTTSGSLRWEAQTTNTAESGANAGSDYVLSRYTDAGAFLDNPLTITRSDGTVSVNNQLLITKVGLAVAATVEIRSDTGQNRSITFRTVNGARWQLIVDNATESSGNAGSNFEINRYDDSGTFIDTTFQSIRSNGLWTLSGSVAGRVRLTGVANTSAPSFQDIYGSASGTPSTYVRLGGIYGDFSAGAPSKFGIFADSINVEIKSTDTSKTVTILNATTVSTTGVVAASPGFTVNKDNVGGLNTLIALNRQASTKISIGLDANDSFVVMNSGGSTAFLIVNTITGITNVSNIVDVVTGFRIGGAAGGGKYLRGDGTNFVSSSIQQADLPTYESVRTYKSAATQTLSAVAGTFSAITFDAEDYDTNNLHDNVTNNSRLTAPTAGKYRITAHIAFTGITSNVAASIRKNGVATELAETFLTVTGTSIGTVEVNVTLSLAATDYVEVYCKSDQANHTILNNQERTYFEMIKVTI